MRLKIILVLALSFISTQTLAFEGTGFKIINEKTTHSPGFKGGFQPMTQKKARTPDMSAQWRGRTMQKDGQENL